MSSRATTTALIELASAPYWSADLYAYYRARGKLRTDPAFTGILEKGLLVQARRILDLGCGQGLLAAWLLAARLRCDEGPRSWPPDWPAPPRPTTLRGIELRWQDVQRAQIALGQRAQFERGDITATEFGTADAVVILDVLHYLDYESQREVLSRAWTALDGEGILLLRVPDASGGIRFAIGKSVDYAVMMTHYRQNPRVYCRSALEWREVLQEVGFDSQVLPMSAGTPFANVMLIARPRKT
jgi:trans-aconitate methyltransferase